MNPRERSLARGLALAFLAGAWTLPELIARAAEATQLPADRVRPLARLTLRLFREPPVARAARLAALLARSKAFATARTGGMRMRHWLLPEPSMAAPLAPFASLALPQLTSLHALARFVGVMDQDLPWFADLARMNRAARDPRLRHYRYRWLAKRSGAYRLLEAPKQRLKRSQRRVLDGILALVPLHDACHGHRPGRSVHSFAAPHVGQAVVLAFDLADFFAAITEARVRAIYLALGYPEEVAASLAGLCCTPTPEAVLSRRPHTRTDDAGMSERFQQRQRLRCSHLPQGAPSSPALANLAAYRLDARLTGLARKFGARYTRYADDLAFSGDLRLSRATDTFAGLVGGIALDEGFEVRVRKTRKMGAAHRQQLCGVVVNRELAPMRRDLERLEAILTNCLRTGPDVQNRAGVADFRAHLTGRVAWVCSLHPGKGAKLRSLLARVRWQDGTPSDAP